MQITIDGAGRVVIPKSIRHSLGLDAGHELKVSERDGRIELEPVGPRVWIEEREDGLVAVTDDPVVPLTVDEVRAVVERSRR